MMNFKVLLKLCHKDTSSEGDILFTVHTAVTQQTCSTLSVIQQSTHKIPQIAIQKLNSRSRCV